MSYSKLILVALLGASLAACSGNQPLPDPEPTDTTAGGNDDVYTSGAGGNDPFGGQADDFDEGPSMVIYFDFDSYEVRPEDQEIVSRHAVQMANDSRIRVRLEGHADERGSREYNIGLGERRSQAVRQMLLIQGVSASQIQTVSFGEERPAATGSSESDYAQNRRVEFVRSN